MWRAFLRVGRKIRWRGSGNENELQIFIREDIREADVVDEPDEQMSPSLAMHEGGFFIQQDEDEHHQQESPYKFLRKVLRQFKGIREDQVYRLTDIEKLLAEDTSKRASGQLRDYIRDDQFQVTLFPFLGGVDCQCDCGVDM